MSSTWTATASAGDALSYSARERRLVIATAMLGWGLEFYDLTLVALLATRIGRDFGISRAQLGAVFTAQLVSTAVGGVVFGWLADLYGRRRVLCWTIWVFGVATAATSLVHTLMALIVLRAITGLGVGGEWAVGYALLNEAWSPKRRGFAGGVVQAAVWPGFAVAVFVTGALPGWRWAFAVGAVPVFAAIWIRHACPESKQWLALRRRGGETVTQARGAIWREITDRSTLGLIAIGTIVVFGAQYSYYVFSSWMPTYLKTSLGVSPGGAQAILYATAVIALISFVTTGWVSDYIGRRKALLACAAIQLAGFVAFAFLSMNGGARALIVVAYFCICFGGGYYGVFGAWFGESFATRVRASGSSFCYSVGRGLASFGPYAVGVMSARYGLEGGISTGMISVLIMMVFACFFVDRSGRVITAAE